MANDVSTLALAKAEYLASAGWFEDQSTSLANRHVTAISALLLLMPNTSIKGANTVGYSKGELLRQKEAAQAYVQANRTAGGVRRADLRRFR